MWLVRADLRSNLMVKILNLHCLSTPIVYAHLQEMSGF